MKLVVRMNGMSRLNDKEFLKYLHKRYFGKNLFMFVVGTFLSALAFNMFFQRYNIVAGGSNGLALLVANYVFLDISLIIFIVNVVCLIIGFIFFGWRYAFKMVVITFLYPIFVSFTAYITRYIDFENASLFLMMIIGGGLSGVASGFIRNSNYSPGGLCSVVDLMHKYLHLSVGDANIILNGTIVLLGGIFNGMTSALYAVISVLISSYMLDRVMLGVSDNKVFYIVTEKALQVREYITDKLHYNVTIIDARGGYSKDKKKMLMAVVSTREYVRLKELVREIDSNAFFLIVDTYESTVKKKIVNN